jgi:prepilin-type processing-associated H-X9-DG protein
MAARESVETTLLEFFHRLRDASVPVSMVEVLDAFACLRHVDLADRAQLRAALAATLVKRSQDWHAFEVLFDVCFPLTASRPAGGPPPAATVDGGRGETGDDEAEAPPSDVLLRELLEALRHDDEGALRALASLAVERFGGLDTQPEASERYYMYRILRQLELYRLIEAALADPEDGDGRDRREELSRRVDDFRRLLAEQVRQRLSARVGAGQAAELYRDRQLEDVDFLAATATQLRELRRAVAPLARKLAARAAQKRRRRRRGRLDVRRTVRRSLSSGGVPVDPAFKAVRASKPDLYVLADVSGSVVEFAKFTLSLLQAMNQEFAKMRSFAFVDDVDEVTGLLDDGGGDFMDLRGAFARANVVWADGHSDHGNVFARFAERYGGDLDARSTVIVMGDARNNYREPGLATLRTLRGRARRLYWLNPEPRERWDTTDSVMGLYATCCDQVFEVRNLRQLGACIDEIV